MAILIEAISVVVQIPAILERYPGGWESFRDRVPNQTLCADSKLARIGFMTPVDVETFISALERNGLVFEMDGAAQDIAVVDQQRGLTVKCSWAECGSVEVDGCSVQACRAVGDDSGELISPDGWQYEGSLSQTYAFTPTKHLNRSLKFLRHDNGFDVYRNTLTGKDVYVGRTSER